MSGFLQLSQQAARAVMSKEIEAPLKNVWQSVLDLLHPETKPKKVEKQHDLQQRCVVQEERERVDSFFQALQLERAGFKPAAASQADEERERRTRENKMMIAGEDRQVVIEDPLKNVWHSVLDLLHIETTPKKVKRRDDLQRRFAEQEERELRLDTLHIQQARVRVDSFLVALQLERAGSKRAAVLQADEERERRINETKMRIDAGEEERRVNRQVVVALEEEERRRRIAEDQSKLSKAASHSRGNRRRRRLCGLLFTSGLLLICAAATLAIHRPAATFSTTAENVTATDHLAVAQTETREIAPLSDEDRHMVVLPRTPSPPIASRPAPIDTRAAPAAWTARPASLPTSTRTTVLQTAATFAPSTPFIWHKAFGAQLRRLQTHTGSVVAGAGRAAVRRPSPLVSWGFAVALVLVEVVGIAARHKATAAV